MGYHYCHNEGEKIMQRFAINLFSTLEQLATIFIALVILETVIAYLRPIEDWIEYESLHPYKETFEQDDALAFTSERIVRKPVRIEWEDTLICDGVNHGTDKSQALFVHEERQGWILRVDTPMEGGEQCYIESNRA